PTPTPPPGSGCVVNRMGIPLDGSTFAGAAHGLNTDPAGLESQIGTNLGIHRTYYGPTGVDAAVRTSRADLAAGRIPWISFKLPASFPAMANGAGDAWAKGIAQKLGALNGPVWLAFHHEPEGDGDIQAWKRMQERLAPIVHANSNNVAFTVIYMGWHEVSGSSTFSLASIWPNAQIDLVGFDPYNWYGQTGNASPPRFNDLVDTYFKPLSAWAKRVGVPWGLAETGVSNEGEARDPSFISDEYLHLHQYGAVADSYFDSPHTVNVSFAISGGSKLADFGRMVRMAPKPMSCSVR
nr:carbohydrate-binding protein CenC [Actinomycetota bacterium]